MSDQAASPRSGTPSGTDVTQLAACVRGYVQGVNYRYHTRRQARQLGLTGYVQNRSDGTVYVLAQGERGAVVQLLEWLRVGPGAAEVTGVDAEWGMPDSMYAGFEVRY